MGYLKIPNLYADTDILLFRECWALEKVHGTSAHITWNPENDVGQRTIDYHSGGEKHERFVGLFDQAVLTEKFTELLDAKTVFYGEAYGGKMQGMSKTYGPELRFAVFDVQIGGVWLNVEAAGDVAFKCGFSFVPRVKVETDMESLDAARDADSLIAEMNGMGTGHIREGVVLRPLIEVTKNNGKRVIAKHKREEFREQKTIPEVDPAKRELMANAERIADEYVVPMRMTHVLDKLGNPDGVESTGKVIKAMIEDVCVEAEDFIVDSVAVRKAIGKAAAKMYKKRVTKVLE